MTPAEIARIDAACAKFERQLRADPQFATYLERRRLGLPVLVTREERAELAWEDEQAERTEEQPALIGVMDS